MCQMRYYNRFNNLLAAKSERTVMIWKREGFTLLEFLVTIAIISILMLFVIPSFKSILQPSQNEMQSSQLFHAIHAAREEAVKHGSLVILCKSRDQKTCSGEWQDGYLILVDNKVLFSFHNNSAGVLHWRAFPYFLDHLEFLPSGLPNFQNGTFWYCLNRAKNPDWAIMISQSGRARLLSPDEVGEINDEKDKPFQCGNS